MLRLASLSSVVIAGLLTGCFGQNGTPVDTCPAGTAYQVDTGATLTYTPGVNAGYYVVYAAGGHWHFEWTCDTTLSAQGCNFTGTITASTPTGGAQAACYQCEAEDNLTVTEVGTNTVMQYDTITTSGVDGVDFFAVAGDSVHVDLMIDGLYQNDLVFLPSGGAAASPTCMPTDFTPSTP